MTEDKQAIEAIAKYIHTDCVECKTGKAEMLLLELKSLGYVKLAEQKLPNKFGLGFPLASWNETEKVQYERGQQDMLTVDSEGCAYRRVVIQEPVTEPCLECNGTGRIPLGDIFVRKCKACNGTGIK